MRAAGNWLRAYGGWVLLAAGAAFLGIGILRGEQLTVLAKAIRVCLECIGLG